MQNINKNSKFKALFQALAVVIVAVAVIMPAQAHAFNILDPLGLFSDSGTKVTKKYYTDSNNVNSNINSPGATVNAVNTVSDSHRTTQIADSGTPVYQYPSYPTYPTYPQQNYGQLQVSCYPTPLSASEGDVVHWYANAYGGNNSYNYSWTGTDGLSGNGSAVSRSYYSDGYKNASVTVISGNQTISKNCDGSVYISGDYYNDYNYNYNYNNYDYNYNYSNPITVSCSANVTSVNSGTSVRWTAYVNGGYHYNGSISWSGTDGMSGSGSYMDYRYNTPGQKYAAVTVYNNGQNVTQYCSNTVQVVGYGSNYINYGNVNTNSGLDVACYADPTTARTNQPVTWRAEVVGGYAPYTYSWSGSDGLNGSDSTVIKYYSTTGNKSGIVTIRSADGETATRACSTSVTVRSNAAPAPTQVVQPPQQQTDNGLSAAALFSLKNVPWGWIAVLIIIVLFATIIYLIYNRPKI